MRQAEFERRHDARWNAFARWLDWRGKSKKKRAAATPPADDEPPLEADEVPASFRRVCADLALARDRQYSPELVARVNALALRGHHALYGAHSHARLRPLDFLAFELPRLVRREIGFVALSALLFFGPLLLLLGAIQIWPEFASVVLSPHQMSQMEEMYKPSAHHLGMRASDTNFTMFGFYIWNNVRIGFQTFAGGLFFGLGSIVFLVFNGIFIGAIAGHLTQVGLGATFWSFVAGHSAMELTAIVLSGAAGLKLGFALVAPGRRSRKTALVESGRVAVRLVLGAAILFFVAALLEAFWSPWNLPDPRPKYAFGIVAWVVLWSYLALAGRSRAS
jgi:uncharacterized membrane protein SpoIIM required for sporulation